MPLSKFPISILPILLFASTVGILSAAIAQDHQLIEVEGDVSFRRRFWLRFQQANVGVTLHLRDRLWIREGSATLQCANGSQLPVPVGPSSVVNHCGSGAVNPYGLRGSPIVDNLDVLPGGSDPQIPYIISPRRTWIFTTQPVLRWNPVPGATRYTAKILGPGVNWSTEVSTTQVTYPGEPPLKPGETYLLLVETDNGRSSQETLVDFGEYLRRDLAILYEEGNLAGLGFSLFPESYTLALQETVGRLANQELSEEAGALTLANVYTRYELFNSAIETLEVLVEAGNQTTAVYHTLGDLYGHIGLNLKAEERYLQVVELANTNGNIEAQVAAQAELAKVYAVMENSTEAARWLDQSIAAYELVEYSQRKIELSETIGEAYALMGNGTAATDWLEDSLAGYKGLLEELEWRQEAWATAEMEQILQRVIAIEARLESFVDRS